MKNIMYKTKDLYEAALFYAKEIPLLRLEWVENKCFFIFQDKNTSDKTVCEELSQKFWNGNLLISCFDYVMAIKRLKERLFARK